MIAVKKLDFILPGFFSAKVTKPRSEIFLQSLTFRCLSSLKLNVDDNDASVSGTLPMSRNVKFKSSILVAASDWNEAICGNE